jgi:biotin carboxylase
VRKPNYGLSVLSGKPQTLSIEGDVHIIAITDKITTGPPRFVEMGHSQPSCLSVKIKKQIEAVAIAAVKAIGIENGPSHTEIIVTTEGPKIVEIGARLGGDNITTHLVPLSTGIDMVKSTIDISLGRKPDLKIKTKMGSAIRYLKADVGKICRIEGIKNAEKYLGVKEIFFTKNLGDIVGEVENSTDRVGFVIAQAKDAVNAVKTCEDAISQIKIYVENEGYNN